MSETMVNPWAGTMGQRWQADYVKFEDMLSEVGMFLLDCADFTPGEKVLDIGFGGGATALGAARAVAPDGILVGVDISKDLVALTSKRARDEGLSNASFIQADAATVEVPAAPFDVLLSRFGVMFFDDPYKAFSHLHSLLKPGGRTAMAVWGPVESNMWMKGMREITSRYVEMPPAGPGVPGPMAFSDFSYFADILEKAGFSNVSKRDWTGTLHVGGHGSTPETVADFAMNSQSSAEMIADLPEQTKAAIREELIEMARPCYDGKNVTMPGVAYVVSATA